MESKTSIDNQWNVEALDKAYRQGFMHGLAGERRHAPYKVEIVTAAWEAGYDDGHEHYQDGLKREEDKLADSTKEKNGHQIA